MKRTPLKKVSAKRAKENRAFNSTFSRPTKLSLTTKRTLKPKSNKLAAFAGWQEHERLAVVHRATRFLGTTTWVICEARGFSHCGGFGEHVHHNFGRKQEPWSSWRHLCDVLCFECHEAVTGRTGDQAGLDRKLRLQLRAEASRRGLWILAPSVVKANRSDQEIVRYMQTFLSNAMVHRMVPDEYETYKRHMEIK